MASRCSFSKPHNLDLVACQHVRFHFVLTVRDYRDPMKVSHFLVTLGHVARKRERERERGRKKEPTGSGVTDGSVSDLRRVVLISQMVSR